VEGGIAQAGIELDLTVQFETSLGIPQGIVKDSHFVARTRAWLRHDKYDFGETRWAIPHLICMDEDIVSYLATALLGGDLDPTAVAERCAHALGREWRWLGPLSRRFVDLFSGGTRLRHRDVVHFLLNDHAFTRVRHRLRIGSRIAEPPVMQPAQALADCPVPRIEGPIELASWLGLSLSDLDWFADLKCYLRKRLVPAELRHYHYRILAKESGNIRLIEAPKDRLKEVQRNILSGILDIIPTHQAAHGFRKGRSIQSFVAPHTAQSVVLKMDLCDFFPSIRRARVQAMFRTLGYPEAVADLLGGLCTTITPQEIWKSVRSADPNRIAAARLLYASAHLPQGAPTSPAIANLCAYRVDCRLAGLAQSAGAQYTRYADDLAFSGSDDFARRVERFSLHAAAILLEEGFEVHHRKTRIMRQGVRQQLAGLVTNDHPNVRRDDYDLLKATLTNCVRLGPSTQNRGNHPDFRAHLDGRVGWVESVTPERGAKLRTIFNRIGWTPPK